MGDPTTSVRGGSSKIPSEGAASVETQRVFHRSPAIENVLSLTLKTHTKNPTYLSQELIDLLIYTTEKIQLYICLYREDSIL